jgi:hypothetical protein
MTAKKFPTPSLDQTLSMVSLPPDLSYEGEEIMNAVQADIALAVESARTVPVETEIALTITIGLNMYQAACSRDSEEIRSARKWLESLTVAPKEVPTSAKVTATYMGKVIGSYEVKAEEPAQDKRCGTCAHFGVTTSECLLPMAGDKLIEVSPEFGRKCPCWKAKP